MPKGKSGGGFGDHIQRIVAELAQADLTPDADHDFINQIRSQIIAFHQQAAQGGQPGQQPGQGQMPGMGGLAGQMQAQMQGPPGAPPGMPTVDGEGLSRGPTPSPDMSGASGELARIMNGR